MKMSRKLTLAARKRHAEGVKTLNTIFGWTPTAATFPRGPRVRNHRLKQKRARAARRANRHR